MSSLTVTRCRVSLEVQVAKTTDGDLTDHEARKVANEYVEQHFPGEGWQFDFVQTINYNKVSVWYTR